MNGCVFKRNLKSGTTWGYSFLAGRDQNGKRINPFKSGYETKGAASAALRTAILDYEKTHGKLTKHRGILGTVTWGYILGDDTKKGFPDLDRRVGRVADRHPGLREDAREAYETSRNPRHRDVGIHPGGRYQERVPRSRSPRRPRCGPPSWTTRRRTGSLRNIAESSAP